MRCIYRHPYYASIVVGARLMINLAVFTWATVIVILPDAMGPTSLGKFLLVVFPEDYYGWFFLLLSTLLTFHLLREYEPSRWCALGYALEMILAMAFMMGLIFVSRPVRPALLGCALTVMVIGVFAFLSGPRKRNATFG